MGKIKHYDEKNDMYYVELVYNVDKVKWCGDCLHGQNKPVCSSQAKIACAQVSHDKGTSGRDYFTPKGGSFDGFHKVVTKTDQKFLFNKGISAK